MNATGNYKRAIKASDLIRTPSAPPPRTRTMNEEERRARALETARMHKKKFWGLIKGRTLEDVRFLGDDKPTKGEAAGRPGRSDPDDRVRQVIDFINAK